MLALPSPLVLAVCAPLVVASDLARAQQPSTLGERELHNLVAFSRLLGYVRHFHPSDAAAATDWSAFAVDGVAAVQSAPDPAALAQKLEQLFAEVARLRVFVTGTDASLALDPPRDGLRVLAWEHRGCGGADGEQRGPYASARIEPHPILLDRLSGEPEAAHVAFPDPREPLRAELGGGVSCLLPLAVYADDDGTLPRLAGRQAPPADRQYSGDDRATRLAGVALAWNVIQHFYPYFDVNGVDWQAVLPRYLAEAAADENADDYLDTLRHLAAELHDGHGYAWPPAAQRDRATLPVTWDFAGDQLVITHVARDIAVSFSLDEIDRGDVVLGIDGRPIADVLAEWGARCSAATEQWRRYAVSTALRLARDGITRELLLQTTGEGWTRRVPVLYQAMVAVEPRPDKVCELRPGICYVDLTRITDEDFAAALEQLAAARGIVFDLRGYPSKLSTVVLQHLTDRPVRSPQWHVPRIVWPDRRGMAFDESDWQLDPAEPRLTAKVAFVTDGSAISYAETYLAIVAHHRLAEIVGEPTAGTNGNINATQLPAGYAILWTGMKTLNQDGSRHHGVGIRPTVPVSRTLDGIRAGRDELLERAIEVVASAR